MTLKTAGRKSRLTARTVNAPNAVLNEALTAGCGISGSAPKDDSRRTPRNGYVPVWRNRGEQGSTLWRKRVAMSSGECPGSGVVVDEYEQCDCDDCQGRPWWWCSVCWYAVPVEPVEPEGTTPRWRIAQHQEARP